ncbi:MAG: HU family DNA-binding protein [Acetobacter sp.]|nr:HU family DNA-binding protein [Acetobacter sp.]MCH4061404.1 HU family DNA-binding protein [Acetobacter sp.]
MLDAALDAIVVAPKKDEGVKPTGFGKFAVRHLAARTNCNPATGESIEIAASRKLTFTADKGVKDALVLQKKPAKKQHASPKTAVRRRA